MKELLCVVLSACLVTSTACSTKSKDNHRPAPSQPATGDQIEQTEQQIDQKGTQEHAADYSQAKTYLDTAVNSLLKKSNLRIKDYDGKDLDLAAYKANPTQGFILMEDEDGYSVLKTSVDKDVTNATQLADVGKIEFTYEVFKMNGNMEEFKGKNLGDATLNESLMLDTKNILANRTAINDLISRLKEVELASNTSTIQQISSFLFPTAYASSMTDAEKRLMITAIVFTSIAVLAYIFSFYPVGDISTAVAIVFWLLFAFEKSDS